MISRLTLRFPPALHRRLRLAALDKVQGYSSMDKMVQRAVTDFLNHYCPQRPEAKAPTILDELPPIAGNGA